MPDTANAATVAAADIPTRMMPALLAGVAAALLGAVLWAVVTVVTKYQIGFMAVGVGLLVGWAVQRTGRSGAMALGIAGALLAFAGCVLGDLLSAAGFLAQEQQIGLSRAVAIVLTNPGLDVSILTESFDGITIVFYAIAIYEGYKFARKPVPG